MKTILCEVEIIVRSKINGNMYQLHEYIENHHNYQKPRQMFTGNIITSDGKISNYTIDLTPENLEVVSSAVFENHFSKFFGK